MEQLSSIVKFITDNIIWSNFTIAFFAITGIYFSIRLNFFQIIKNSHMWKSIFKGGDSDSGISAFASFCTAMAMRIGTGNIAGVAVAVYWGGPGSIFWMWIIGILNAAISFVECTLAQLYKTKIDGEYRGSGAYCADKGLNLKWLGVILSVVLGFAAAFLMPAAATFTIADSFSSAAGIPNWVSSGVLALVLAIVIMGGVKRIGAFSSVLVPVKVLVYFACALVIFAINWYKFPEMFAQIFTCAFGQNAAIYGGIGAAIAYGVRRGTFASASGMGEAMPAAAASEVTHPVKQGFVNAGGVFICTLGVCTCTGFMLLLTGCYATDAGFVGNISSTLAAAGSSGAGAQYVQAACATFMGDNIANWLIAILLLLFGFTSVVGYYYEAETSFLFLFQKEGREKARKVFQMVLKIIMVGLIVVWGLVKSDLAWNLSDLALGIATILNIIMLWVLAPKAFALYKDYCRQIKLNQDPFYDPNRLCWKGVDKELWLDINKNLIEAEKAGQQLPKYKLSKEEKKALKAK